METTHLILTILKIALALLGAWFLYREVRTGYRVDEGKEIVKGLELIRERASMYDKKMYKEILISVFIEIFDYDQYTAADLVSKYTPAELQTEIENYSQTFNWTSDDIEKLRKRKNQIKEYTEERAVERRKVLLTLGIILIFCSGVVEFIDVLREARYI